MKCWNFRFSPGQFRGKSWNFRFLSLVRKVEIFDFRWHGSRKTLKCSILVRTGLKKQLKFRFSRSEWKVEIFKFQGWCEKLKFSTLVSLFEEKVEISILKTGMKSWNFRFSLGPFEKKVEITIFKGRIKSWNFRFLGPEWRVNFRFLKVCVKSRNFRFLRPKWRVEIFDF